MKIKIWTVTTDCETVGTETRAFATEGQALGAVDQFCAANWDEDMGEMPENPRDAWAALQLFDCQNMLWLGCHTLELELVQAWAPGYLRPPVGDTGPTPWIKGIGQ